MLSVLTALFFYGRNIIMPFGINQEISMRFLSFFLVACVVGATGNAYGQSRTTFRDSVGSIPCRVEGQAGQSRCRLECPKVAAVNPATCMVIFSGAGMGAAVRLPAQESVYRGGNQQLPLEETADHRRYEAPAQGGAFTAPSFAPPPMMAPSPFSSDRSRVQEMQERNRVLRERH